MKLGISLQSIIEGHENSSTGLEATQRNVNNIMYA
jgi:hypothetical protein